MDAWDKCSGLVHLEDPEGWGGEGGGRGGLGWGTHVNPWLIHVNVWQKPLQYCKVISLQLIKINGKKKTWKKKCSSVLLIQQHYKQVSLKQLGFTGRSPQTEKDLQGCKGKLSCYQHCCSAVVGSLRYWVWKSCYFWNGRQVPATCADSSPFWNHSFWRYISFMSHFILVFPIFSLVSLAKGWSVLFIFSKNQLLLLILSDLYFINIFSDFY